MQAWVIAVCAVLLDRLLGEPRRAHPLVAFGHVASALDSRLNGPAYGPRRQRLHGMLAVILLLLPLAILVGILARAPILGIPLQIVLVYLTLGGRSLAEHAQRVVDALRSNELDAARRAVSFMVSRDTASMQAGDVARAAVESVLENGNDAVFGTLFWFLLAGAPGAVFYRLTNTLDAMWGYRTPRYRYFGWTAARLDDLLNYIPARLTALTYAILGQKRSAWHCWHAQGCRWESPNAGPVMAAGAGALGVTLGGAAIYHGERKFRPVLGQGPSATGEDIGRAMQLVGNGVLLWLGVWFVVVSGGRLLA